MAWALTDLGKEVIVIGKGISFGKKLGDEILDKEIEKYYHSDETRSELLNVAVSNISEKVFLLTEKIISKAKAMLDIQQVSAGTFVSLADHLDYALKRGSEDVFDYPDNLKWEVKRLYPKEYDFATDVLYHIEKETDIRLPKSEITFLVYHFVNLQYGMDVKKKSYELSELLNRAIEIIQYHYQIVLDQNSINYIRFVTHVRHFILRQMNHEIVESNQIEQTLVTVVKDNYKKAYQAAEKISNMIETRQSWKVSEDEKFYLALHIERVTNRK